MFVTNRNLFVIGINMLNTPKSLRLQIALFGKTNVGKSSLLNMLANQDIAVTSPVRGTTTDVVEKPMELLPIGPVTILDTAGLDDVSILAEKRIEKAMKVLDRADIVLLVIESSGLAEEDKQLLNLLRERKIPCIAVVNKIDVSPVNENIIKALEELSLPFAKVSALDLANRDKYINDIKQKLIAKLPDDFLKPPPLLGDLVKAGGLCMMIVPIDLQAPKGRLILPQVQAIRDVLDSDAMTLVVKEREYAAALQMLKQSPDLVICDSQVVQKMIADTPSNVKATTFSILFSRNKGDIVEESRGAAFIDHLRPGDKVLIAEACSHHPAQDDIGRVKLPRWLRQYLGFEPEIDVAAGRDFPDNLEEYKLIFHCGSCMLTRNEKLVRIMKAKSAGVPITNYGIAISKVQGVLARALSPFPAALEAYLEIAEE